ncbi:MAG: hypothetical protein SPI12_05110 [Actinomycetaceae bacterium]|nr:hypothetical protein [Actinomycetaceae bacterium]MDY6083223.1 hypothetical protein [Actinomycetaceae bacterium]
MLPAKFLKLAIRLGPAFFAVASKYGPQLIELMRTNPDSFSTLTQKIKRITFPGTRSNQKLEARVQILHEQVVYLYASANTAARAHQAQVWRQQLENIERSLPVLGALSTQKKIATRRKIQKKLDSLATDIAAMTLMDHVEDAEIVTDEKPNGSTNGSTTAHDE